MEQKDLLAMLRFCRPAWSRTESQFIRRFLDPVKGMHSDQFGNRIHNGDSRVLISCHTDTVHWNAGKQHVWVQNGLAMSDSDCLGADDTAGVYAALRMIEAGVNATFLFHRAEEIGGHGSRWLAARYPQWLEKFDVCLALDRRGTADIVTHQLGDRTASDEFALSLAGALDMGHRPARGIFTDSANYADLIPECSNLSVGYTDEHSPLETLNLDYLDWLVRKLAKVDWGALEVRRNPLEMPDDPLDVIWEPEPELLEMASGR